MTPLMKKLLALLIFPSCAFIGSGHADSIYTEQDPAEIIFQYDRLYLADGFDFPVGKPDAKGYYNAQGFTKNNHLGDDWNGLSGGNTDLGDTIYAIGNGYVTFAEDIYGGWGNVIRILHKLPPGADYEYVESLYAHADTIFVKPEQYVRKGDAIGTIGNNHGVYYAHLHLEIRHNVNMEIGGGYSTDTTGFLDPTSFIKKNRKIK